MNWTGGRLQRHSGKSSRGGGALTNRQKEHFAKVKANLRSGCQKNSPAKWSIFDRSSASQSKSQGQRLESHSSSGRNYEHGLRGKSEKSEYERERWDESEEHDQNPALVPFCRESKARYGNNHSPSVEIVQRSLLLQDLYNATPSPLRIKHQPAVSPKLGDNPQNYETQEPKEESMEEKRRKLLSRGDWVGLSIRRLPQTRFNFPKNDGDIGRRRIVKDGHKAIYSNFQTRISSPFAARKIQMCEQEEENIGARAKSDVRIRIGDRVIPPGISSSSRQSKAVGQSTPHMMHRIFRSDEMLLDDEYITEDCDNLKSDRVLSAFKARAHVSGGQQNSEMSFPSSGDQNAAYAQKPQQEPKTLERVPLITTNIGETPHKRNGEYSTFPGTAENSVCEMNQPIPRRLAKHSVLNLGSPNCNSSVIAQVGGVKCVVPRDEVVDNETWEVWMASSTGSTEYHGYDHEGEGGFGERNVSISPGISAIPTFRSNIYSGSRSDDDNSGQYEQAESWEGCESSMIQEYIEISEGNATQTREANCISNNEVRSGFDSYSQPLSTEYGKVLDEIGVPEAADKYYNEGDILIEPQCTPSSQRTSSSISWNPPFSQSPSMTGPYQHNVIENLQTKTSRLQHGPVVASQSIYPDDTLLQQEEGFLLKSGHKPGKINDFSAKCVQRETDQNELWMRFVFDEDSEDDGIPAKNITSTRTGLGTSRGKPPSYGNFDMTFSHSSVIDEKREGKPSPASSTFVHNSVDTENSLQPRYFAPTQSRAMRQNLQLGENGAVEEDISQFSEFSTSVPQFKESCSPPMPSARARNTLYIEKQYRVNRDSNTENYASVVPPINSYISKLNSAPSSEPESVSMVAVPGSQMDISGSTLMGSFLGRQRKVIFTRPQPFVGFRANAQSSSPDRTIHVGGVQTKKEISDDYGMTLAEEIEDD
ncbi:hypothetical protein EYC80_011091 [Monilinia laxa]|uniref:Uncharacterized protein n=1 Tax=Monilinia laxa TaxID=61186 RepID=A0A5N6JP01_MONLA|nr:hypothetical protein EYC80_011091 [Monilinia laxa]